MNYEKASWSFDDRNYTPADTTNQNKYIVWYQASVLTGNIGGLSTGIWTVYSSNDGTSFGNGDSVDHWNLGTYTPANLVVNKAWIVLKSPTIGGANYYMIIDMINASVTLGHVTWSKAAPTGGTATARPTATDEWTSSASTITWGFSQLSDQVFNTALASDGSFHICISHIQDGSKDYVFCGNFLNMFNVMANVNTSDTYPVFTTCNSEFSAQNAYGMFSGGTKGLFWGVNRLRYDSTHTTTSATCLTPGMYNSTSFQELNTVTITSISSARDNVAIILPVWVFSTTSPWIIKGRLVDYYNCQARYMSVEPFDGTGIKWVKRGYMWTPGNKTPILSL
jgi:hypothetical protein